MHLINCTPHAVHVYDSTGTQVVWSLASKCVVRVRTPPQQPAGALELHGHRWPDSASFRRSDQTRDDVLAESLVDAGARGSIPVVTPANFSGGEVAGLPEWARDHDDGYPTALIVGIVGAEAVARAWGDSGPVYATDTGPESVVRDSAGNILGVRRLILVSCEGVQ